MQEGGRAPRKGLADHLWEALQDLRVEAGLAPLGRGLGAARMRKAAAASLEAAALRVELLARLLVLHFLRVVQLLAEAVLVREESRVDGRGDAEVGLALAVVVGGLEAGVGGGVGLEVEVDSLWVGCEG